MVNMNPIQFGTNQFCGPSVISAICGITTDEAVAVLQNVIGNTRKVTGVYERDLIKAFDRLNYRSTKWRILGRSIFSNMLSLVDGVYVFMVPGHYVAIEVNGSHRYICDNHTKSPINVSSSARLGMKVVSILKVEKM